MKTCAFASDGRYGEIIDQLNMYVGKTSVEKDIRPFMLSYRTLNLYVMQLDLLTDTAFKTGFGEMESMIRMAPSTVFASWTNKTTKRLEKCLQFPNFVDCNSPDWVDKLVIALKKSRRLHGDKK